MSRGSTRTLSLGARCRAPLALEKFHPQHRLHRQEPGRRFWSCAHRRLSVMHGTKGKQSERQAHTANMPAAWRQVQAGVRCAPYGGFCLTNA